MSKSALLLVNRTKPDAVNAVDEVRSLIERKGSVVGVFDANSTEPIADAKSADLIVVLGGDGTLLSQSRRCIDLGLPMLGVNFGKLGFMAEFDMDALREQADTIFGDAPVETRSKHVLRAEIYDQSGNVRFSDTAMNDAVVNAGPPFRIMTLSLSIDGEPGPTVRGDGLIISTPVGSTAYNVAAGGPIVAPHVDAMVVTPIAAHSLSFRPIVVSSHSQVSVSLHEVNDDNGGGTTLVLDGQVQQRLYADEKVVVRQNDKQVRFVHNAKNGYWATLIGKMQWASSLINHETNDR